MNKPRPQHRAVRPFVRHGVSLPWNPPLSSDAIHRRESLCDQFRAGLGHRLIMVQAGPGFGKTLFLASLVHKARKTRSGSYIWLTLEHLHRDRFCLLEDLVHALRTVYPQTCDTTLSALSKSKDAIGRWDYVLDLLCSEIAEVNTGPTVLILDQYERLAGSTGATGTIDYLLHSLPKDFAIVLATRQPLEIPSIQSLRAEGEVWDLSCGDLCFTEDETQELAARLGVTVSDEDSEVLLHQTRGWPAGIQMVISMMRTKPNHSLQPFSDVLSDVLPDIYDYLDKEVFNHETTRAQSFLIATSLVNEITPELGHALASDGDAFQALARLERGYYFVSTRETSAGHLYRYNPIFRDFLLKKAEQITPRDQLHALHRTIAEYYNQNEQWDPTILHLIRAGEYDKASDLVASIAESTIATNNLETLARWVDAFPEEERDRRPWLLLYRGVVHRVSRQWEDALALYNRAAEVFKEGSQSDGLARALWYTSQIFAYRNNQKQAIATAAEALKYLDPSQKSSRAWILHIMGNAHFDVGETNEALSCHKEAEQIFIALENPQGEMAQTHAIALALFRLGRLKEAQQYYLRALSLQTRNGDLSMLCWVQGGLARLRALRGDYSSSVAELKEVAEIAQAHHLYPAETFVLSCLADTHLDLGNYIEARHCCERARVICQLFEDDSARIELRLKLMEIDARTAHAGSAREQGASVASWISACNLEIQRLSQTVLEAGTLLAEERYDEAEQKAQEAKTLAGIIGALYYEAQANYILAQVSLCQKHLQASANMVKEMLTLIDKEGYLGFLVRDAERAITLLCNALNHLPVRSQLMTLIMKLAGLRPEIATELFVSEATEQGEKPIVHIPELLRIIGSPVGNRQPITANESENQAVAGMPFARQEDKVRDEVLRVFLLGPVKIKRGRYQITDRLWRTSKAKELFAYLLDQNNRSASRDELLDVLWPEQSIDAAVRNFHFTLHSLRRALEPQLPRGSQSSFIVLSGKRYLLDLPSNTWIDAREFRSCIAEGSKLMHEQQTDQAISTLERAIELYQGDYLADLYAGWAEPDRQNLLRSYLNSLRHLAWSAYVKRDFDRARFYVSRIISRDSYAEDAHRLLMQLACDSGSPGNAIRHYNELTRLLESELGVQPERATQLLHRQIVEGTYQSTSLQLAVSAFTAPLLQP